MREARQLLLSAAHDRTMQAMRASPSSSAYRKFVVQFSAAIVWKNCRLTSRHFCNESKHKKQPACISWRVFEKIKRYEAVPIHS